MCGRDWSSDVCSSDLVGAAIQTIIEIGDATALEEAVSDAFDGASLQVGEHFQIEMQQYGLLRPLSAAELSDGTLRYILLVAALLSPRPPELMILNEPEGSLHPDLLEPLARLLAKASKQSQIIVVSHSRQLVAALDEEASSRAIELHKDHGETFVADPCDISWKWPKR